MEYYAVSYYDAVSIKELDEKQLDIFLLQMRNTDWDNFEFRLGSIEIVNDWAELQAAEDARWRREDCKNTAHIRIVPASLLKDVSSQTAKIYAGFMCKLESRKLSSPNRPDPDNAYYDTFTDRCRDALDCCCAVADNVRQYHSTEQDDSETQTPDEAAAIDGKQGKKTKGQKGKTVDDKLEDSICRHPEKADLSAERLADILGCSKASIVDAPTWKKIMGQRGKKQIVSYEDPGQIPAPPEMDTDQD